MNELCDQFGCEKAGIPRQKVSMLQTISSLVHIVVYYMIKRFHREGFFTKFIIFCLNQDIIGLLSFSVAFKMVSCKMVKFGIMINTQTEINKKNKEGL